MEATGNEVGEPASSSGEDGSPAMASATERQIEKRNAQQLALDLPSDAAHSTASSRATWVSLPRAMVGVAAWGSDGVAASLRFAVRLVCCVRSSSERQWAGYTLAGSVTHRVGGGCNTH